MIHELKIWPQYYCRVADGSKTFEVRENDRGFQPGDKVRLREYDPSPVNESGVKTPKGYTDAPTLEFEIGYMYTLDSRKVVFSLLPVKPEAKTEAKKVKSRSR